MMAFIHQPGYLPWLGFFDKLARCDKFVVYDDVQFAKGEFNNRNRIRTEDGWRWLTVPVVHNHTQMIKDILISGDRWSDNHIKNITHNYRNAPYFKDFMPGIEQAISASSDREPLIELDMRLTEVLAEILGIKVKVVRSSEFTYHQEGEGKNEKIVSMCKHVGADTYLSGQGGKGYIDESVFSKAGVKVVWHDYKHPEYEQMFEGFQPFMSVIDLIFNSGPEEAKRIIMEGGIV